MMTAEKQSGSSTGRHGTVSGSGEPGRGGGFAAAALSFVAVFAAGATAIPLYDTYRAEDAVTESDLSIAAVGYFACAVFGLLVLGRLSNHFGRRPVSIASLVLAIGGCAVLMTVNGFTPLLVGRALQGMAAGLASSALAAYAVDTAPSSPKWLVSTVTSASTTIGLSIGAFGSGALVQFAPAPRTLVYAIAIGILVAAVVSILASPETVEKTTGALKSLKPSLRLPEAARPYLPVAAAIFVATWSLGGYYQSFGPSIAADDLGSDSPLVAAAVFASYMAPSVVGGPLTGRLRPAGQQRLGMILVGVCVAGLVTAIANGSAVLFIVAGVVGGIGMGAASAGAMRLLLPGAAPADRAGVLAVVFAISYSGAAIPSLIAGQLSKTVALLYITVGYGVLVGLVLVIVLLFARNPRESAGDPRESTR